jgi:hypothetical protein
MTEGRSGLPLDDASWLRAQAISLSGETAAGDDPGGRDAAVRI